MVAETHDLLLEELASLQRIGDAAKSVQSVLAFGEDTSVIASLQRIAAEAEMRRALSAEMELLFREQLRSLVTAVAAAAAGAA